jgi:hypothetical protein
MPVVALEVQEYSLHLTLIQF